ncbi:hypothetical protein BV20DRAFT_944684, partial [Pilatotrama ljubarskyi]
ELHPSISFPTEAEVIHNVSTFFDSDITPPPSVRSGFCLMIDRISIDERGTYWRGTNEIVGLCWEHTENVDLRVLSVETVQHVAAAVSGDQPLCHYGKECTVAALALFRATHYTGVPVLVSATCKSEKAEEMVKWMQMVLDVWRRIGQDVHGPIWCITTDGDGMFRRAKFLFLLAHELDPAPPLHQKLYLLKGLNLKTGPDGITMDADYKHINKRFATLLRHREGNLVLNSIINRDTLARFLLKLPGMNPAKVAELIDPSDHQNVPKAVQLLQKVRALTDLEASKFTPSEHKSHVALCLLGELFYAFLEPFFNLDLTLSEQLNLLSCYSPLAFIMYRHHQTSFMTSQLYADTQMTVKNIFFCVAKQQLIDPTKPYYIIHNGTDRLERNFCNVRTQDHARNFDTLNLSQKLSVASLISSILMRHPNLDRGHRQIKMTSKEGPDHTNPTSMRGDVRAGNVSLLWAWREGRQDAERILARYAIGNIGFDALFSHPDVDLLRPLGDGKYVSFTAVEACDQSVPEDNPEVLSSTTTSSTPPPAESHKIAIDLEDLVATESADSHTAAGDWIEVVHKDGSRVVYHKSSLVQVRLTAQNGRMVIDRTLKYYLAHQRRDCFRVSDELTGEATDPMMFYTYDIGASLVRCSKDICLALLKIRTLLVDGKQVSEILVDDLANVTKTVSLTGQVLSLTTALQGSADVTQPHWQWSGAFLQMNSPASVPAEMSGEGAKVQPASRLSRFIIGPVPGWAFFPVSPDMLKINAPETEEDFSMDSLDRSEEIMTIAPIMWCFKEQQLLSLVQDLWENMMLPKSAGDVIEKLPVVESGADSPFPYRNTAGASVFTVQDLPVDLRVQKLDKELSVDCKLCLKPIKVKNMCNHAGGHILRAKVGIIEAGLTRTPDSTSPCGFCGLNGCMISMSYGQKKKIEIRSNCQYHYNFSYNAAITPSVSTPSTNVPLHCPMCPADEHTGARPTYWKYNIDTHIHTAHPELAERDASPAALGPSTVQAKHISLREARSLGVADGVMQSFRTANELLGSDDIKKLNEDEGMSTRGMKGRSLAADAGAGQRKRVGTLSAGGASFPVAKRAR